MAGQMCMGAVQAAISDACQFDDEEDASQVEDQSLSFEGRDSFEASYEAPGAGVRFREGHSVCSEPHSPSLMSVLGRSALFGDSPRRGIGDSPAPDSPSLIVVEGGGPLWTDHKALPPRSPTGTPKKERAVLLGIPAPLSARGRERCVESAPLSARYKKRPAGCVGSSFKFGGA